jgi:hypothetical protein
MEAHFNAIKRELQAASEKPGAKATGDFLTLLGRVFQEADQYQAAALLTEFGKQFKPAGDPVLVDDTPRQFAPGQQVWTPEGYLGFVAGHGSNGHAVVNVVWQACDYPEKALSEIPGQHVLLAMKQ